MSQSNKRNERNERKFTDVFPDLELSPAVDMMLRDTNVTRVVMYNEKQRKWST